MKFRWFELPDDHEFIYSVRSLVDGFFKVVSWLLIAATLQVAAEATRSAVLWAICGLSYLMIFVYLQVFISWISHIKFGTSEHALREFDPGRNVRFKLVRKASAVLTTIVSFLIWATMMISVQTAIERASGTIVEFQKSVRQK